MMVLYNRVQVRRPHAQKPLRKPSMPTGTTSRVTNKATICDNLVQGFKSRILHLDEDNFETVEIIKKEILTSLNEHALNNSACLQLFLDTAWKDRNRTPIIAHIFHDITQDYDDESITGLSALLEKTCNDLLNILTLLGKPEENDLSIVTLLANLYRLKDLPEEHKEGVESYLIDIAKAFWPYFVPQKREVWDNELVSDAICDVFQTVGFILENRCPVNMERTFNKITTMLYSINTISDYTRLRLLEVKESRAADWSLQDSAKDYYKSAFLQHSRRSSDSDSRSVSPSCLPSTVDNDVFDSSSAENSPPTTPLTTKTEFLINEKYEVSISKNCPSVLNKQAHPLVLHIKEKPEIEQNNNIKTPVVSESTVSREGLNTSTKLLSDDKGFQTTYNKVSSDLFETSDSPPLKGRNIQSQRNDLMAKSGGFGSPKTPVSCTSSFPEQHTSHNTAVFSRNSSTFSRGFSCPETNTPPSISESPFSRHDTYNTNSSGSRNRLSSEGEMRPFNRNGGLHRSQSESSNVEMNYYSRRGQISPGCDTNGFGNGSGGGGFDSWRPNLQRQSSSERFKTNLEFPVKDNLEGEDLNPSSRLYLLSFATTAAALERPFDLTLTAEIETEKKWLKSLILDKPLTVKDRFGRL